MVNWILGALIFGYATWVLVRFIKKSKQGKCAQCSIQHCKGCSISSQKVNENREGMAKK